MGWGPRSGSGFAAGTEREECDSRSPTLPALVLALKRNQGVWVGGSALTLGGAAPPALRGPSSRAPGAVRGAEAELSEAGGGPGQGAEPPEPRAENREGQGGAGGPRPPRAREEAGGPRRPAEADTGTWTSS